MGCYLLNVRVVHELTDVKHKLKSSSANFSTRVKSALAQAFAPSFAFAVA
jgi:hypothetical protein